MIKRKFWIDKIEKAWKVRSIVWLAGVRRVGKTSLCQTLDDIIYFDCERLQVREQIERDYELFLREHSGRRVVLDEVHKLQNPSEILKVAADHYPETKIIATGSSTIEASKKFSDALTGRKVLVHLTPMLLSEGGLFGNTSMAHRMLYGGLPFFFLSEQLLTSEYKEWFNSFWAKDVHELFQIEKRASFLKFTELMFAQSGSMFVASKFAVPCQISHPTVSNYLAIARETLTAVVVRPYSTHVITEIRSAPKVYSFDTGFACYTRGWTSLRESDYGVLWEHLILNELIGYFSQEDIHYWRDKSDHEIDFIFIKNRKEEPVAIECKWNSRFFNPLNMKAFRKHYPKGENYLVSADLTSSYKRVFEGISVTFVTPEDLIKELSKSD